MSEARQGPLRPGHPILTIGCMSPVVIGSFAAIDAAIITQLGYALHQLQDRHDDAADGHEERTNRPARRDGLERRVRSGRAGELLRSERP